MSDGDKRIQILRAFKRSGEKQGVIHSTIVELLPNLPRNVDRLVVFTWRQRPGFQLRVIEQVEGGRQAAQFTRDLDEYQQMLKLMHEDNQAHEFVRTKKLALFAAMIPANENATIRVAAVVDTNSEAFCSAEPQDLGVGVKGLRLHLQVDGYAKNLRDIQDARDVQIDILPATNLARFRGHMAIDFGNTSSTLVRLRRGVDAIKQLDTVRFDIPLRRPNADGAIIEQDQRKVPSTLEVLSYEEKKAPKMPEVTYSVGNPYAHTKFILGAKRMMVDVDQSPFHLAPESGEKNYAVRKPFPAELIISSLLSRTGELNDDVPFAVGPLAVTYPSTYSGWEVAQLKTAVYYAIRRSLGVTEYFKHDAGMIPPSPEALREIEKEKEKKIKAAIPLLVDEASAASIYYLYKDFIKVPGSIRALRYLYPTGLRILLYDCGGGTTDVALVKAVGFVLPGGDERRTKLQIDVLGRTGDRSFGGDDMTEAVFRILKTRLATRVLTQVRDLDKSPIGDKSIEFPDDARRLPNFMQRTRNEINQLIPTEFKDPGPYDELLEVRRNAVNFIWEQAQKIKHLLCEHEEAKVKIPLVGTALNKLLDSVHGRAAWGDEDEDDITFRRSEVDALLAEKVNRSIEKVNSMLEETLDVSEEVDVVYVVGNASRYPYICEQLKKQLKIRFIEERLRFDGEPIVAAADSEYDPDREREQLIRSEDLKGAVAKGACLALMITREDKFMELAFDREIVHKLPCDIVIPTLGLGQTPPAVFSAGEHCHHLEPHMAPAPQPSEGQEPPTVMRLQRRWPGEQESEPFLEFDFKRPIVGPVEIAYDRRKEQFTMRDTGTGSGKVLYGKQMPVADYVSPVQSGKL